MVFVYPAEEVPLGRKLGEGSYGMVYQSSLNGLKCAVKVTNPHHSLESINELDVMCRLSHPYLMSCLGLRKGKTLELILPYADYDLKSFSKVHSKDKDKILTLLFQVAVGLAFLHSQDLAHLDLTLSNIMIFKDGDDYVARISDFGLTSFCVGHMYSDRELVTVTYRAPESFRLERGKFSYSKANDIWSLGLVIIRSLCPRVGSKWSNVNNLLTRLRKGWVYDKLGNTPIGQLVNRMLSVNPNHRPTIDEVVDQLGQLVNRKPVSGQVNQPSYSPRDRNLDDYKAIDRICHSSYRLKVPCHVTFSAIDIYYRSQGQGLVKGLVCLSLAIKCQGQDPDYLQLGSLFELNLTTSQITELELQIAGDCQGIINYPGFWLRSTSTDQFELVRDGSAYVEMMTLDPNPIRYQNFYDYYPTTQYWSYLGHADHIDETKLQELYEQEACV